MFNYKLSHVQFHYKQQQEWESEIQIATIIMVFKQGYLSISNCHLPNEVPFFCSFRCCPMILDYSLNI